MTDFEIVMQDRDGLYLGNLRTVDCDLKLPIKGKYGSDISWTTSHDRIIREDGTVLRPVFGMGDREVTLIARIVFGQAATERTFEARVLEAENKIRVKRVFPIELKAEAERSVFLPSAAVIETESGTVMPHAVEWIGGEQAEPERRTYPLPGMYRETGYIAGTAYEVQASVRVLPKKPDDEMCVRLTGESCFLDYQKAYTVYLEKKDDDRMLWNFRDAAGLDTKGAKPLLGWEAPECRIKGHTTGHYLSALALCYRAGGNSKIYDKAVYMCRSLKECQDAFAEKSEIHEGFLSAYDETQFDQLEQYVRYPEIWAPYYALHKIMAGLLDCYEYAGITEGLEMAEKIGYWVYNRLSVLPRHQRMNMWSLYIAGEFGGMNEVMARLAGLTGEEKFVRAAEFFENDKLFYPLARKIDALDTLHANQHIPQIIGCMEMYRITGEQRYLDISEYFWECVTGNHTYVIGGVGEAEMFHAPGVIGRLLTKDTAESCASYNMLKLTRQLYKQNRDVKYMHYYERTLYNHIAASACHDMSGGTTYFLPLAPGFSKTFSDEAENTCCHGTGMENHFKYTEAIYDGGWDQEEGCFLIYVNLYIPSVMSWGDLRILQELNEEKPGEVNVAIEGGLPAKLRFRVPQWGETVLYINGHMYETAECGGWAEVFYNGEEPAVLQLKAPYRFRVEKAPDVNDLVVLMYGPYVMAVLSESREFLKLPVKADQIAEAAEQTDNCEFKIDGYTVKPLCMINREPYHVYIKMN